MPEGLESGLTASDLASLLAWLTALFSCPAVAVPMERMPLMGKLAPLALMMQLLTVMLSLPPLPALVDKNTVPMFASVLAPNKEQF